MKYRKFTSEFNGWDQLDYEMGADQAAILKLQFNWLKTCVKLWGIVPMFFPQGIEKLP